MTLRAETIGYQHDGVALEGLLVWDDAIQGPRPGVLVSHAWAGQSEFEDSKAQELAGLGYAGFSLDLYGKGVRGNSKEENMALMQPFMENRPLLQERWSDSLLAHENQWAAANGHSGGPFLLPASETCTT